MFEKKNLKLKNAENYFKNTLSLPIYVGLKQKDQMYIVKNITKIIFKMLNNKSLLITGGTGSFGSIIRLLS